MVKLIEKQRGLIMTGTKNVTMEDLMAGINQMNDRLSEIELILNDPLHGIDLPEGLTIDVGSMDDPTYTITTNEDNMNGV
jgi:hypothetical protein